MKKAAYLSAYAKGGLSQTEAGVTDVEVVKNESTRTAAEQDIRLDKIARERWSLRRHESPVAMNQASACASFGAS
jgi:hypothetical protein